MKQQLSQSFKSAIGSASIFAATLAMSLPLTILGGAAPAQASCIADNMGGRWENVDPNTRGITAVDYVPRCGDVILCDETGDCSKPARTSVQVFGACHPTDCDWGASDVEFRRQDNWRYTIYDQGFARRVVWMRLENNGRLTVAEQVDYRDSRTDRTSWYSFNRASN